MAIDLTNSLTYLELRLQDPNNLIYSTTLLTEAIRSALQELSSAYGEALTLEGLDTETETTFSALDLHTLLVGAHAYALQSRLAGKADEPNPTRDNQSKIAELAANKMEEFQGLLTHVKLRRFQETTDHPYSEWEWDEGEDFS